MMHSLFRIWSRYTLPHLEQTTPAGREKMRYAHLLSGFLLFILTLAVLALPLRLFAQDTNGNLLGLCADTLYLLALFCNKRGWIGAAGVLFVVGILLTEMTPLFAQTAGFDTQDLPLFDRISRHFRCLRISNRTASISFFQQPSHFFQKKEGKSIYQSKISPKPLDQVPFFLLYFS